MKIYEITTLIIASWGAILSTVIFILDRLTKSSRLRISIRKMIKGDMWDSTAPNEEIVLLSITNIGDIDVLINQVWILHNKGLWGMFKKEEYFWKCSEIINNMPQIIAPRREIHFLIPAKAEKNLTKIGSLKKLRLVVTDSVGKCHYSPPLSKTMKNRTKCKKA